MKRVKVVVSALLAAVLALGLAACGRETYTVSFNSNGGSKVEDVLVEVGKSTTLPTPKRDGFTFDGWLENAQLEGEPLPDTYTPTVSIQLHARWKATAPDAQTYTVTFETNGGSVVSAITATEGSAITLPIPSKTGFHFCGWFSDANLTQAFTANTMPSENVTLYAKWEENTLPLQLYTVSFNSNGGSKVEDVLVEVGKSTTLPTPKRDGFTFEGWFENAQLEGEPLADTYTPTVSIQLHARWKATAPDAQTFTVTFETNGGSAVSAITATEGSAIILPVPSKTDFSFHGWFSDANLTQAFTANIMPSENVTLYAKWATADKYFTYAPIRGGYAIKRSALTPYPANIVIPDSYNSQAVTAIEDYAFSDSAALTAVTIPDSIESIGHYAFSGCALTEATVPGSVTYMGDRAFYNCSALAKVQWNAIDCKTAGGSEFSIFRSCGALTEINFGASVRTVPAYAFRGCDALTSVRLPDGATSVGAYAFSACGALREVTVSKNVIQIGDRAFSDCPALTRVLWNAEDCETAGSSNNAIFKNCGALSEIIIADTVRALPQHAFRECSAIESVTIPDGLTSIGTAAFSDCDGLTSVIIPDTVTNLGDSAFAYCDALANVTVGSRVAAIGYGAFTNCVSLISVTIPDSATKIEAHAFSGCRALASVSIGNGVTSIGDSAFYGCAALREAVIPNSVTSVGAAAFNGCTSLVTLSVGDGVKSIGNNAFTSCVALTDVNIGAGAERIGDSAFSYCTLLTRVTIGNNVASIGRNAFEACDALTAVTFENDADWYVTKQEGAESGTQVDLTDTAQNASLLKDTYKFYYFYKK